jgi:hypothetical protein
MALVQLIQEHPELPRACWAIDEALPMLRGSLHGDRATFDTLAEYAHQLGGAIRPSTEFTSGEVRFRSHELLTTWRDVKIRVAAYIPLAVSDAYIAEGRAVEIRHQFLDADEPPLAFALAPKPVITVMDAPAVKPAALPVPVAAARS